MQSPARRARPLAAALLACLAAGLCLAAPASAHLFYTDVYNGSFNGSDAVGAPGYTMETLGTYMTIDQQANIVYVGSSGYVFKFNSAGHSEEFSALSPNTVFPAALSNYYGGTFTVDNSATATQGRIYAFYPEPETVTDYTRPHAYLPSGEQISFPISPPSGSKYCGGAVSPVTGNFWLATNQGLIEYTPSGTATGTVISPPNFTCNFAIDSQGNFYVTLGGYPLSKGGTDKYSPTGEYLGRIDKGPSTAVAVDLSNDDVYVDDITRINHYNSAGNYLGSFGWPEPSRVYTGLHESWSMGVDKNTHEVYVARKSPTAIDTFLPVPPITVPDVTTEAATVNVTNATLHATVNPDGVDTTDCHFEWGTTESYGNNTPCAEGSVLTGSSGQAVTASLSELTLGQVYHFRIAATNASGIYPEAEDLSFRAADKPAISGETVTRVNTDGAELNAEITPNGAETTYHFEYGADTSYGNSVPVPDEALASNVLPRHLIQTITGLSPETTYHYRVTATNEVGTTTGSDHNFTTFPRNPSSDPCPNAHVRQQTGAALLFDCRAYELVSAANAGGNDVESNLVAGQTPYPASPQAPDRVLYSLHSGTIPGVAGDPTNFGLDPYVASRGPEGWSTRYVGLSAATTPSAASFSSALLAADEGLETFAFGGEHLCSPCFADGSSGIPVHLPDGSFAQGMAGDLSPGPAATPDGYVAEPLSADGSHLVFASTAPFELDGNSNGDVSIYERNLRTGVTQVVSKTPAGANLPCLQGAGSCHSPGDPKGIAELGISADGSRVLIGQLVSTDAAGNHYYHLYMHVGEAPAYTIDLMPGASSGALYDGMSAHGTMVYFATRDGLTPDDTDSSADIYRADVGASGATLTRVSTGSGGTGDTDACDPAPNSAFAHWNTTGAAANCDAVAIAGGGGVASADGSIYFLSPEQLDGATNGTPNAPNLYLVRPGSAPRYVTTLESVLTGPQPPATHHNLLRSFGALSSPAYVAVDRSGGPSNGDVYVADTAANIVEKFDPAGNLITSWGAGGALNGQTATDGPFGEIAGIAVDGSGRLYVLSIHSQLFKFNQDGSFITDFKVARRTGPGGIAVDGAGNVYKLNDNGSVEKIGPSNTDLGQVTSGLSVTAVAVDSSSGDLYIAAPGAIERYSFAGSQEVSQPGGGTCTIASFSGCAPSSSLGASTAAVSGLAYDPASQHVFVDQGDQVLELDSSGSQLGSAIGAGVLSRSVGVALDGAGNVVYVTNKANSDIAAYSRPSALNPDPRIDNPLVLHAVGAADKRDSADFQVSPNGDYAVFSSTVPLTSYPTLRHSEIYRYDAPTNTLDCASCPSTGASPTTDTSLASGGLNLSGDGRVFFTTDEILALRDADGNKDVYEWENGRIQLITTGTSTTDSGLLSASADGKDVYFFTRQTLVAQDENGATMKIYDAREGGGYPSNPAPLPCAASDECHGPGTQAAGPPNINSLTGSGVPSAVLEPERKPCRKGFVKRSGKCVKPARKHHQRKHRARHGHG